MTSLIMFERAFREELLNVIYAQWHRLGASYSDVIPDLPEVIDPEALLWCSFEFLPTEPRLFETVTSWLHSNENYIIRHRFKKQATDDDPRTDIWHALDRKVSPPGNAPTHLFQSEESREEITDFFKRISRNSELGSSTISRLGKRASDSSTILLRARDLLGNDTRPFLLVYLLANPKGGKLRTVQAWSGYAYRSISEAAARWQDAGIAVVEHGYCYLADPEPWRALLQHRAGRITLVNWFALFEACVGLLRALTKARQKNFAWDNPVVTAHRRNAYRALSAPLLDCVIGETPSVARLCNLFPRGDRVADVPGRKTARREALRLRAS
jgi:hypothetical protein